MTELTAETIAGTDDPPQTCVIDNAAACVLSVALASNILDPQITHEHFTDRQHQIIFDAIVALSAAGQPFDICAVALKLNGKLEAAGGAAFIAQLSGMAITEATLPHYVQILKNELHQRRAAGIMHRHLDTMKAGDYFDHAALVAELAAIQDGHGEHAQWHTPVEILTHEADPAHILAGDGWLRRGGCTLLTGGTGMGKSVLAMQLAACAAAGVPFFRALAGGIRVPRPCRVIYIQAENDLPTLQRDLHGVMQAEKLDQVPLANNLRIVTYPGDTPARLGAFLQQAVRQHAPDVIVIDPYSAFIGSADINTTEGFFMFRNAVGPALATAGMLLVCHTPKPQDRQHWTAREGVYLAAGTSALANWARCSCELTNPKADQDERYKLRLSKNAERAGLPLDLGGTIRRDIFLEHGHRDAPCWIVSECQDEERKLSTFDRLRQLLETNPKMSTREAAKVLDVNASTICRYMHQIKAQG